MTSDRNAFRRLSSCFRMCFRPCALLALAMLSGPAAAGPAGAAARAAEGGTVYHFTHRVAAPARANHYWDWGWGLNVNRIPRDPLDTARFDWSTIALGNVGLNQDTLDYLNRVLEFNPEHRFLLRVWPVMNLGARNPQNRFQTTMWDYFYTPGQKERVLETLERQISFFLEGLDDPESIMAVVFCEELPSPVAVGFSRWRKGRPLPWDIAAFAEPIEADLGEPFDMMNTEHRLWWGRKFAGFLGEIHREIKRISGGRTVVFWPVIAMTGTLDELAEGEPIIDEHGYSPLPIYYRDIVKPGVCDGIFGYPGKLFMERTVNAARELNCLYFTQVSSPSFMRLVSWEDTISEARLRDPLNLGPFVHIERDRPEGAWNAFPSGDGEFYTTWPGTARTMGWRKQINIGVLERNLEPEIALDYDFEGVPVGGVVHARLQVFNPVSPTWFGGDAGRATFRNLVVRFEPPEGFRVAPQHSGPAVVKLGDLAPHGLAVADWWVERTGAELPDAPLARAVLACGAGREIVLEAPSLSSGIPALEPRRVAGLGERWVEPAYRLPRFDPAVVIEPLGRDLVNPSLSSGGRTVTWRGVLSRGEVLVIGPGAKASVHEKETETTRDAGDRLSGVLRPLERFATTWAFSDEGEADFHARPVASVQFFDPEQKERVPEVVTPFF